jgi:hypothetical protein
VSHVSRGKWAIHIALMIFLSSWLMYVCYFMPVKLTYFNSPDSTENVLNSYYISNGWIAFRDFANNHFPGVYLTVGWLFKVMGVGALDPSLELSFKSHFYASYVVTFWQLVWFTAFFSYIFRNRYFAAGIATGLLFFLNRELRVLHVLSETMILPLFSLAPLFLHRALWHLDKDKRLQAALFLAFPWAFFSLWLGLTAAPSTVAVAAGALLIVILHARSMSAFIRKRSKLICCWSLGLVAVIIATLGSIDLERMLFFNFPFNRPLAPAEGPGAIWSHASAHFRMDWQGRVWPLSTLVGTTVLIILNVSLTFIVMRCRYEHRESLRNLLFKVMLWVGIMSVAAVLAIWRYPFGYKTVALLGLNLGLMGQLLILIGLKFDLAAQFKIPLPRFGSLASFLVCGLLLILALGLRSRALERLEASIRPLFVTMEGYVENQKNLREKGICAFRDAFDSACICMRTTHFNPGDFLTYNMRQCQTWGVWIILIPYDSWSSGTFEEDSQRKEVGFLLVDPVAHGRLGVPASIVSRIKSARTCRQFDAVQEICI